MNRKQLFHRYRSSATLRFTAAAIALSLAMPAGAQLLEEVLVTAQKREESIQDVGIAVTAFTGEQLDAFGFTESTQITAMTPGVFISGNNGGTTQQFTIRGSTQNDFADIAEGPNAVYIDEAYMALGQSQLFAAFDTERVEILKGPQGTLFGRNATGGLVHYITRKPTAEREAFIDVTYGRFDTVRTEAAGGGAIIDGINGRVSVLYNRHDPVIDNVFSASDLPPPPGAFGRTSIQGSPAGADDLWKDDQIAVRGQLLFELPEENEFLFKVQYANQQTTSGQYQHESTTAVVNPFGQVVNSVYTKAQGSNCEQLLTTGGCGPDIGFDGDFDGVRPNTTGDLFGYTEPDTRDLKANTDHVTDDYDEVDTWGVTGKLNWDFGFAEFVSVTAYHQLDKRQSLDVDSGPAPQFIVMNQSDSWWLSQELRLEGEWGEKTEWIAGFYYLHSSIDYAQGLADSIGGLNIFSSFFGGITGTAPTDSIESTLNAELDTDSYSLFGQIDYDLTDMWSLTFGLRAILEKKKYTYRVDFYNNLDDRKPDSLLFAGQQPLAPNFALFPVFNYQDSFDKTLWSGKAQLNFTPTDDLLLYFGVNRGVKAGSYNAPLLTPLTSNQFYYNEEVLVSYEGGFKWTTWGGRARVNASFYYYDYSDYQAFQFIGTSGAVVNADADYYGMELEIQANPIDNLDFVFGMGLIDAEVKDIAVSGAVPGAPAVLRDVQPTFTPSVQLSGIARYVVPDVLYDGDVAFQMDANYASSAFHNINNFETHKMDAYVVGNARVTWYSDSGDWELGGFVNNLSDSRYQTIGFELSAVSGSNEETIGRPRWWGISARYNFD